MKIEVVSALPHSTVHSAVLSRRHRSIICAGPYEVLPLETCFEPLPSTSSLAECPVECLQLSTDERTIGLATNAVLKVADIITGREVRNLTGHILPITSLAASKFSPYCWYTGCSDATWSQWDTRMAQSKIYGSRTPGVVRSVALSPGDHYVAVGTDESIQIFDARQREYVKQFNCSGHNLELHPSDVLLSAVGHDRIVRFFCLESFELISQSDPFLDDIQASAFDTHVMIAATADSINLLTWEPCDVLTTVPLKNVEKVVNVSANVSGLELDFICVGRNTERLEMRSYAIEELLSYSPSHELCGSIYEEDEDVESAENSPIEESKPLPGTSQDMLASPVPSSEELSSSPVNSSTSSHSSPPSPVKPCPIKQRSKTTESVSVDSTKSSSTSQKSSTLKTSTAKSTTSRSVTPVMSKPPVTRSMAAAQSKSAQAPPRTLSAFRSRPSPSMSDLRTTKTSSIAGSMQSLISERGPKTRSASNSRHQEPITITYLGRPRTPSEGDVISSTTSHQNGVARRRPSPAVKKTTTTSSPVKRSPAKSVPPVKKQDSTTSFGSSGQSTSSAALGPWGACFDIIGGFADFGKKSNRNIRRLKMLNNRRLNGDVSPEVCSDEQLVLTASQLLSRSNDWSLNTCHGYLPTLIENITSTDVTNRSIALDGLSAIAATFVERLVKFANANSHRIGVDVAAEERAEKATVCIQRLREIVKKRDWYYKQLDEDSILKLDAILEHLKKV